MNVVKGIKVYNNFKKYIFNVNDNVKDGFVNWTIKPISKQFQNLSVKVFIIQSYCIIFIIRFIGFK